MKRTEAFFLLNSSLSGRRRLLQPATGLDSSGGGDRG